MRKRLLSLLCATSLLLTLLPTSVFAADKAGERAAQAGTGTVYRASPRGGSGTDDQNYYYTLDPVKAGMEVAYTDTEPKTVTKETFKDNSNYYQLQKVQNPKITGMTVTDGKDLIEVVSGENNTFKVKDNLQASDKERTATLEMNFDGMDHYRIPAVLKVTIPGVDIPVEPDKPSATVDTAPNAITDLTYNGKDQTLVTAGEATGGEMRYSLISGESYSENIPVGKNAGDYTVYYIAKGDAQHSDSAEKSVKVTIAKKEVTITGLSVENKVYDGTTAATITGTPVPNGLVVDDNGMFLHGFGVATFDTPDAGTGKTVTISGYALSGNGNAEDNYELKQPAGITGTITPAPLTIDYATATNRGYEAGNRDVEITSVTFKGWQGPKAAVIGTDYTATGEMDTDAASTANRVHVTVDLMGAAAKNYTLEKNTCETSVAIFPLTAPILKSIVNHYHVGTKGEQTVDLSGLVDNVTKYTVTTQPTDSEIVTGVSVGETDGILKYTLTGKGDAKSSVNLSVNIESENRETANIVVEIHLTDKSVPTLDVQDIIKTYDAKEVSANEAKGKAMFDGKEVPGKWSWKDAATAATAAPKNVDDSGTYTIVFTPDDAETYAAVMKNITVAINEAYPTGKPTYTLITSPGKTLADAKLNVGDIKPEGGSIEWIDDEDYKLSDTTVVEANKAYRWLFTPGDNDLTNYRRLFGTVVLYPVSGGGSSSGGGGGSSGSSKPSGSTGKTETVTKPDGTTVKTETKADGTTVKTETKKDGSVTKTETKKDGSSVTETKAADGSTATVKTDKNGQTTAETKVSAKAVEDAKKNGEAVKALVEVEATKNSNTAPVVKVELPRNSGDTKVEIPVTNVRPGTVAVIVHPDGTEEIVKNSLPTADGIQLTVNGSATVKILDNSKDFADTRNHWAKDAIDFVSARGLVNGMNDSIYAPNASTTRAQLWTILARQNDADLNGGSTWFENAQNWAKEKGISDGANPNGTINRAQMVTMLWRAMGQPAAASGASFTDVSADSYYAQAVAWAIENGITAGVGGGKFDPNATCTRAQIATFLYRYMK